MVRLEVIDADGSTDAMLAALDRDGAVIIRDAIDDPSRQRIDAELRPYIDRSAYGLDDFAGRRTTRTGALARRSPSCRPLISDRRILAACDAVLLPSAVRYQVNLTQAIRLLPDQPSQMLHRDRWCWGKHLPISIEPQLGTMWALTEFTRDNGATLIAPGSHRWELGRDPTPDEVAAAAMPAGSVLLYTGSVIHGAGENRSACERIGINITYSLGWLRQEENQYLSCPPEVARTMAPEVQELLGYTMAGYALGYFSPVESGDGRSDMVPPEYALGRWATSSIAGETDSTTSFVPAERG